MLGRLWPFVVGSVALGLDAYVIAGLLPAIAGSLHAHESTVGLGVAVFTGSYALVGPLLAGRAGRRSRRSLALALAVFTAANLATAAAPTISVFLGARAVAGAAAGVYSPLSSAVAAAVAPDERRGRALAFVLAGLAVGTVFGVPAGLLLAARWGWRAAILLITVTGAAALVGIGLRGSGLPAVPASTPAERWHAVTRPVNLVTVLVTLTTATASLGLYTYLSPVLAHTGMARHQSLGIWIWGAGGAIGALGIGRLVDRVGSTLRLSALILTGLLLALVALTCAHTSIIVAGALFLWGLCGWASLAPQQHTLLTESPHDGATAVAANASANYLGSAIGATLGSAAITAGAGTRTLSAAASTVAALAVALQLVRIHLARHQHHAK